MRAVISEPKTGKSFQVEIQKDKEAQLNGRKIGEEIDGGIVGAAGYSLKITGGSDASGFPMRADVSGARKVALLLTDGTGFHAENKGSRKKRIVRGNICSEDIVQVNLAVATTGPVPLTELFRKTGKKEEAK